MHAAMACIIHATESVAAHQTPVATYKIERKISAIGLHNARIRPFFCTYLHSKCKSSEQRHRMCSSLSTPHLLPKTPSDRSNLVMFNYQRNAKPIRLSPPRDLVSAPGCHTNAWRRRRKYWVYEARNPVEVHPDLPASLFRGRLLLLLLRIRRICSCASSRRARTKTQNIKGKKEKTQERPERKYFPESMMRPRLRCICKTVFPGPQVRDRDTKLQHVIPSGPSLLPRLSCRARCARCCEERRCPCPQVAVFLLRLLPRTMLFPLLEACIPPQNEPSLPPCPCPHNYIHQQTQQLTKMPIHLIQQRSGIPVPSSIPESSQNQSSLPTLRPHHPHPFNSRPKRLPTYIQQHSGILIASSIPEWSQNQSSLPPPLPTTPSHSSTPTQPTKTPACLPTYLPQHSGTLVASSTPESSQNNKIWKTESRKSRTVSRTKAPECPENIRNIPSSSSTFSASTQITLSFQKMLIFLN